MKDEIKVDFIGRESEIAEFERIMHSDISDFISVIGRRRVGKTVLINHYFKDLFDFKMTGLQRGGMRIHLKIFAEKMAVYFPSLAPLNVPGDWLEAFAMLRQALQKSRKRRKKVIFFDELPWIATHKSKFLESLAYFWNDWASTQNMVIIVCGSSAAWMIRNIVRSKGGLHNRITKQIHLKPFNLYEIELFLKSKNISFSKYQMVQIYMMMGGIPHYLKEIKKEESVIQNIDRICFSKGGLLKDEFDNLFRSLYRMPERHISVIRALSSTKKGMTRKELIEAANISDGGGANRIIEELETSDFIASYVPFDNNVKGTLYRLIDGYSLFYLKFIESTKKEGKGTFLNLAKEQKWKIWSGYAFENVCFLHIAQIKYTLGIRAVYTQTSSYRHNGNDLYPGFQIDMLLDRADQTINLIEIKFYDAPYTINKKEAAQLRQRKASFRELTKTRKNVLITYITTYGLNPNEYESELVPNQIEMDFLFIGLDNR